MAWNLASWTCIPDACLDLHMVPVGHMVMSGGAARSPGSLPALEPHACQCLAQEHPRMSRRELICCIAITILILGAGLRMGGDRDGNPFVTPETTREVVLTAHMAAISEYEKTVEKLMYELSVWRCNDDLQVRVQG